MRCLHPGQHCLVKASGLISRVLTPEITNENCIEGLMRLFDWYAVGLSVGSHVCGFREGSGRSVEMNLCAFPGDARMEPRNCEKSVQCFYRQNVNHLSRRSRTHQRRA